MAAKANQQILFVTGKGGVGRSTVAASIAMAKASANQRTLLVELGTHSFYSHYFQLDSIGYHPTPLRKNLDIAKWSGQECLKEYALYLLKIESLYKLFFENPVTKTLVNVAPALTELAILGKATSQPRKVGPPLNYDCIVIDAFASGHFMALLRAPVGMMAAIKFGPMADQSKSIFDCICDPDLCKYFVVSFPEELPVVESLELSAQIEALTKIKPISILNRQIIESEDLSSAQGAFADYIKGIQSRQKVLRKKLLARYPLIDLPMVFSTNALDITQTLAMEFKNA